MNEDQNKIRVGKDIGKYLSKVVREHNWLEVASHITKGSHVLLTVKLAVYAPKEHEFNLFEGPYVFLPPRKDTEQIYEVRIPCEILWDCGNGGLYVDAFQYRTGDTYRYALKRIL